MIDSIKPLTPIQSQNQSRSVGDEQDRDFARFRQMTGVRGLNSRKELRDGQRRQGERRRQERRLKERRSEERRAGVRLPLERRVAERRAEERRAGERRATERRSFKERLARQDRGREGKLQSPAATRRRGFIDDYA